MKPNDATIRQIEAADPRANTWLSANAGSGKTRVLTDRVARLLLSGVSPQNILCLTYTKAAASEMQNRLFARLGRWAMQPEEALRKELFELGVTDIDDLAQARRLFAGAIETPGGIKIQTIHSFCAAILRRFPLEAGISPDFREVDDRTARLLLAEVLDDMASGDQAAPMRALARIVSDQDFTTLAKEILSHRQAFADSIEIDTIPAWFGLEPGFDTATLEARTFLQSDEDTLARLVPILRAGAPTEQKAASKLAPLVGHPLSASDLPVLEDVFLTKEKAKEPFSAKIGSFPNQPTRDGAAAALMPALDAFMARVEQARPLRIALDAAQKTMLLHRFARPFIAEYERRKQAQGWLDFDDLITLAGRLLNDPGLAAWVLYRLDGGIDHILVDEAQDTSPAQWRVIESLSREFTSGESARSDAARTLFVVGDVKQSIYSFQGADPAGFNRMRKQFDTALHHVGGAVQNLQLEYSFRSSYAILNVVDHALQDAPGVGQEIKHRTLSLDRPGRVDIWPVIEKPEKPGESPWFDPVDAPSPQDASVLLANAIADGIEDMLATGSVAQGDGTRRVTPGDIMVLVRRRSELFHQIIRACKNRNLPIAGADRLRVGGELAVKDITALLAFLTTPEDDLSLAAALRSPLFNKTEDDLFRLAYGRGEARLWHRLRESEHTDAIEMLTDLRNVADYLRPYELIDRILTRHDGRRALVGRLGSEAEDGIDALLTQALAFERLSVPSLTGFLAWLAADDVEIKRQMDSAGDQIRVMTVHGAKGLEAPIVILPDTAKRRGNNRARLQKVDGRMFWRLARNDAPPMLADGLAAEKQREEDEAMRLLYVAMTRAESWLVVAAAGDVGEAGSDASWYRIAEKGAREAGGAAHDFALGRGLRHETGVWSAPAETGPDKSAAPDHAIPSWAITHAPHPEPAPKPLAPSDLGGSKVVAGLAEDPEEPLHDSLAYGRQLHRLLEVLPSHARDEWPDIAPALLRTGEDAATPEDAAKLLQHARNVLEAPHLAHLFEGEALAEVELSASAGPNGARIHGTIDRLIVTPDSVLAIDFKTNRVVPESEAEIPEGILRQLGAYEAALKEIFPNRDIQSAILWTMTATLMKVSSARTSAALGRLDAAAVRP